ncbi:Phage antitermination protein Q [Candidatus Regiella insecticola 5.15]|uniref:Phage antitermination protein Q n=1 Tax=Candidatus Regiella insecticola 5.15 TaxID=1005043 RepID=G2GZW8_9ENTR|nr:antiterminator Q family protein [Candidatus Regiella insecticola]EGY28710.1 Phage antitermination protein Q [Candidatus Regiella insecticola 5.15]
MRNVTHLLEAWGNWSGSRIGTEYQAQWPLCRQESDTRLWLSDEEGVLVDQAVASLKGLDSLGYDIIIAHYRGQVSCRAMARRMNKRDDYMTAYLGRAEAYIAGYLHDVLLKTA